MPSESAVAGASYHPTDLLVRIHSRPVLTNILALTAGACLTLAFAPLEIRIFAFVAPAVAFLLWRAASPRRALWLGWLFGVGLFGSGVSWIYFSLHLFGDAVAPLAALLTVVFVLLLALFPAGLGYLLARLSTGHKPWLWFLLAAPAAWMLVEWVRGWFLSGFPWLLLGYSQVSTPLAAYGPVIGVYGLSWLTALTAASLAFLLIAAHRLRFTILAALALVWGGGLALERVQWTTAQGSALRAALLQGNIAQHQKFLSKLLIPSLQLYEQLSRQQKEVDLIVWPETAIPTLYYRIEEYLAPLAEALAEQGTDVVTGVFTYDRENDRYHNSLRKLGDTEQVYHKRHLVPFGEYMPLRPLLAFLSQVILIPMSDIAPGRDDQAPLQLASQLAAPTVCYEIAYGDQVIAMLPEASFLINVSNDGWFGDSLAPHQHLEIARMRALETGRPMLRATNTGVSAIIDHRGKVLDRGVQFQAEALRGTVQPRTGATPYVRWGNLPAVLWASLLLVMAYFATKKKSTSG